MKFVIVTDSNSAELGYRYLRDRKNAEEHQGYWTDQIKDAMQYTSRSYAERRMETIKLNNPRILEI